MFRIIARRHLTTSTIAMGKKAVVLIAPGSEEIEAVVAIDVLRRGGIEVIVAGISDGATTPIKCSRGVNIVPDISADTLNGTYDLLVLPGGLPGTEAFIKSETVGRLLKAQEKAGGKIGTICAAPLALKSHGIALGKRLTSYPTTADKLSETYDYQTDARVVVDGNLITSRGPGTAFDFALRLIEELDGRAKAVDVAKAMLLDY